MHDVLIVGGGLFGCIIAKKLAVEGMNVCVIDDGRPLSGSQAAACLMKPGWASAMTSPEYDTAIDLLEGLFGPVTEVRLRARPTQKQIPVSWLNPRTILHQDGNVEWVRGRVLEVTADNHVKTDCADGGRRHDWARHVILCTGAWVKELVPELSAIVTPKGGYAFTWVGQIADPFLQVWAPYRQIIGFNRGPGEVWCGDGSALIEKTFTSCGSMHKSMERCVAALGDAVRPEDGPKILAGYRPYFSGVKAPALVRTLRNGLHVATGGGKNGTLGAAWSAKQFVEKLT